jgi:general L-amino acid transport system permease protein
VNQHTTVPFWRDVRVLTVLSQVAFVLLVIVAGTFLLGNLSSAMRQRGLASGFGFLNLESGFEIGEGLIPYRPSDTYGHAIVVGLLNTLLVSVLGIALSTVLGVIVGVARLSANWLVRGMAAVYVEIIRNTPLLLQLIFIYFGVFLGLPPVANSLEFSGVIFASRRGLFLPRPLPSPTFDVWLILIGVGLAAALVLWFVLSRQPRTQRTYWPVGTGLVVLLLAISGGWFIVGSPPLTWEVPVKETFNFVGGIPMSPEFSAVLFGLVLYTAGFIAEVVRGGIQAVRPGQVEAARALGLDEPRILQLIIFPQAMRVIVPPLTSQYLNLAKNSSLAIAIGFPDVFSVGSTVANQTGQPVPVIVLIMATYLVMSLITSLLMNLYNRHVQVLEK